MSAQGTDIYVVSLTPSSAQQPLMREIHELTCAVNMQHVSGCFVTPAGSKEVQNNPMPIPQGVRTRLAQQLECFLC